MFTVHSIYLPQGLIAVAVIVIIGLVVSMVGAIRNKPKPIKYRKLMRSNTTEQDIIHPGMASYQNQSTIDYTLPAKKNDVTYCVIDGRLANHLASRSKQY